MAGGDQGALPGPYPAVGYLSVRDHGGGIDAAVARWGGARSDWLDLSTGINPATYPAPAATMDDVARLPASADLDTLERTARRFWDVPTGVEVVAAPGTSALIATIPGLRPPGTVSIPEPTYNEHAAAFRSWGWRLQDDGAAMVAVNPNNPDGRRWHSTEVRGDLVVVDESFCDLAPDASLVALANRPGHIILKSMGKFWGLAGLRLGFAISLPDTAQTLRERLGPWAVSGPAMSAGTAALADHPWAEATRLRLNRDAERMDRLLKKAGLQVIGGTSLFRLAICDDARALQEKLARCHILVRIFPYSGTWVRFGLPGDAADWARLDSALK